jgi:hypothetical protein
MALYLNETVAIWCKVFHSVVILIALMSETRSQRVFFFFKRDCTSRHHKGLSTMVGCKEGEVKFMGGHFKCTERKQDTVFSHMLRIHC